MPGSATARVPPQTVPPGPEIPTGPSPPAPDPKPPRPAPNPSPVPPDPHPPSIWSGSTVGYSAPFLRSRSSLSPTSRNTSATNAIPARPSSAAPTVEATVPSPATSRTTPATSERTPTQAASMSAFVTHRTWLDVPVRGTLKRLSRRPGTGLAPPGTARIRTQLGRLMTAADAFDPML
jgi:hypothetical protein